MAKRSPTTVASSDPAVSLADVDTVWGSPEVRVSTVVMSPVLALTPTNRPAGETAHLSSLTAAARLGVQAWDQGGVA